MEKEQKLTGLPMPLRPINESLLEIDILLKTIKANLDRTLHAILHLLCNTAARQTSIPSEFLVALGHL
jgi:hypothetical protein